MGDRDSVETFVQLGLTRYESQVYLALIGRGDATPAEIARMARIPRQRVYDVLSSLAERGLVRTVPGGSGLRYQARPPDQVADTLLAVQRRELDRLSASASEVVARLATRYIDGRDRAEPLDYVEVLRDPRHAVERVEQLWAGAEYEVLTLVRPPYVAPPAPEEAVAPTAIVKRAIYDPELLNDPGLSQLLDVFAELGEEIRLAPNLPMKMTIVDGRAVAFNLPDPVEDDSSITTLVVHHGMLASTLKVAFEAIWSGARTLAEAQGASAP